MDPTTLTGSTRRRFVSRGAALALGAALAPSVRSQAFQATPGRERLVVVLLRGAVDGLNVVVPYADPDYARNRPTLALSPPGEPRGVLPLDATFGLNPALAGLMPLWESRRLAFVHACGSPDPTRSHFDAQDYLETATPGRKSTPDGWMNRLLSAMRDGDASGTRAVNLGTSMPRILVGEAPVASLSPPRRDGLERAPDGPALLAALDGLYAGDPTLAPTWTAMHDSQRMLAAAGDAPAMDPRIERGALQARALAREAARLGRLMRREPDVRLAFLSVGGWDTHVNQGAATGQLANNLAALADGLDSLVQSLGERFDDTLVLVMSEFGRTVRENGTRGTDHGHGNVVWALGGPVAGGAVYGRWPGLADSAQHEGRDLAITTDFRLVIATALERHLRLSDRQLERVLPVMPAGDAAPGRLLRG